LTLDEVPVFPSINTPDEPLLAEFVPPSVCILPELANILSAAQAVLIANAVRSLEPFGLSVTLPGSPETNSTATVLVHDLFLPTDEKFHGQPVLRGIDTNHSIFVCSRIHHLDTWVISSSSQRGTSAKCEGDVWIDRLSGKAQLAAAAAATGSSFAPTV
jgi:hypothetical protein